VSSKNAVTPKYLIEKEVPLKSSSLFLMVPSQNSDTGPESDRTHLTTPF